MSKKFLIFSWVMAVILALICFIPLFYGTRAPIILYICLIIWDIVAAKKQDNIFNRKDLMVFFY